MTLTLELAIFIVVALVAIFSAAFMLLSRNAVHSALFLVTNFACVAFFYLMLNAPFLAMIQITVYAGAIMVLFMFVIMLLGGERLGEASRLYSWIAPIAAILAAVFLVLAVLVVVQANVVQFKPVQPQPQIRAVHALYNGPAVDVYVNDSKTFSTVGYEQSTNFITVPAGKVKIAAYPACAGPEKCPDQFASNAKPLVSTTATLEANSANTYVLSGTTDAPKVLTIPTDMSTLPDENSLRLIAANELPGDPVSLVKVDPGNAADLQPLTPPLAYGQVSETVVIPKGRYNLVWKRGDERLSALTDISFQPKTGEMLILAQEPVTGQAAPRLTTIEAAPVRTNESFGSPQQMGFSLLGAYLLPFELVSLLLLAAMVGAIILTREEVVRRVRHRLVVSPSVSRINAVANPRSAGNPAETSAD
jgi:NADH:ubiquinone oxidoreductase subunit 6 (subunit J)